MKAKPWLSLSLTALWGVLSALTEKNSLNQNISGIEKKIQATAPQSMPTETVQLTQTTSRHAQHIITPQCLLVVKNKLSAFKE